MVYVGIRIAHCSFDQIYSAGQGWPKRRWICLPVSLVMSRCL